MNDNKPINDEFNSSIEQQLKSLRLFEFEKQSNEFIQRQNAIDQKNINKNSPETINQTKNPCIDDLYKLKTRTRQRKFEKTEVTHHSGHGFFGGHNHTHVIVHEITYKEIQEFSIDSNGNEMWKE